MRVEHRVADAHRQLQEQKQGAHPRTINAASGLASRRFARIYFRADLRRQHTDRDEYDAARDDSRSSLRGIVASRSTHWSCGPQFMASPSSPPRRDPYAEGSSRSPRMRRHRYTLQRKGERGERKAAGGLINETCDCQGTPRPPVRIGFAGRRCALTGTPACR